MRSVEEIISILIGKGIVVYNIIDQKVGDKDIYGGRIKLHEASIILIMLGLVLIFKDAG